MSTNRLKLKGNNFLQKKEVLNQKKFLISQEWEHGTNPKIKN